LDCKHTAYGLQGSFVAEVAQVSEEEYNVMVENWICIEDEEEVINAAAVFANEMKNWRTMLSLLPMMMLK
jgi:hypothetical protein